MFIAKLNIGELCNGSTTDSDSVCWGSNPYSPAKKKQRELCFRCFFIFAQTSRGFEQGRFAIRQILNRYFVS